MNSLIAQYKSEYSRLIRLGLPVLITQLGIIVVSFADNMMVGAYGVNELAAAAFVNSFFLVAIVMQIGFSQGLTPLVGALFGQHLERQIGRMFRGGLQMNILVSIGFSLLGFFAYFIIDKFGQPIELLPLIREYYIIILLTLIPMAIFGAAQQTCNGMNNTALPMWMILLGNGCNIFGNWLLIYGNCGCPELGLLGAGISTLISRWISAIGMLLYIRKSKRLKTFRIGYAEAKDLAKCRREVWVTSYPVMLQCGIESAMWSFGAIVCGWFGKVQIAAYQVVNTIGQLGFMTYISFGTSTSICVANYAGERNDRGMRRVTIAGLHLNLLLATIASLLFYFGGEWLIGRFTPNEAVIASGVALLFPLVVYQYMDAIQLTYCNAIRGTSHVKPLLLISLVSYVLIGVPSLLLFAKGFNLGNVGVFYSFDISLAVAAIMSLIIFYRLK